MKKIIAFLALFLAIPAFAQSATMVTLTWTAPATSPTPVVSYNAYRETTPGACSAGAAAPVCVKLNSTPISALTFVDATLPANVKSFYVVRAVNANGVESVNSNEAIPPPPTNLSCTGTSATGTITIICK